MMTGVGVILGTAAYMSPEQAKGRAADKRSDVWALRVRALRDADGRRAFDGEDVSDTLATVLKGEPTGTRSPSNVPPRSARWFKAACARIGRERIGDISTALFLLNQPAALHPIRDSSAVRPTPLWRRATTRRRRCARRRGHCGRECSGSASRRRGRRR